MGFVTRNRMTTLGLAFLGVLVFHVAGLPLPFLLGPMFLCLAGALMGARMQNLGGIATVFRTFLGVAAGASITPDVTAQIPSMALSLAIVPLFILTIAAASYPMMRRLFGFDPVTSFYAAMPGGLQDLMVFGEEAGANMRALALVHATRVLLIVSVMPLILGVFWNIDLTQRPGMSATQTPLPQLVLFLLCGIGGWQFAKRLGIFGASIIGPMVLSAILSMSGVLTQRPPAEMIWATQFFIGLTVGAKYSGVTLRELKHIVLAGAVNGALLSAISALFILGVISAGIAPSLDVLLAYLPGGQGEMVVLAIIAGADLTYVVLHHILRIFLVVTCAPIVFRLFDKRPSDPSP